MGMAMLQKPSPKFLPAKLDGGRLPAMFLRPFLSLFHYRSMLAATTLDLIRKRYSASYLGMLWVVLYPVIFLGLYVLVFVYVLQVKLAGHSSFEYVILIFAGLIPFLGFTEALAAGVTSVVDNKALIKNVIFPIELVPVQTVLASSVTMLVGLIMLMAVLIFRGQVYAAQLLAPLIFLIQLLFTVGLIWLLSILNVFFRDISTFVSPIILFLMLISPIAYTIDMIPKELMPFMYWNPLFYLIMIYREALFFGRAPWEFVAIFAAIAFAAFNLGYFVFMRLKGLCSDYV
jgi:lipopolysaccharide transport system permease protein